MSFIVHIPDTQRYSNNSKQSLNIEKNYVITTKKSLFYDCLTLNLAGS